MAEKSMALALILSFFITGLGIAYAGDVKKWIMIIVVAIILGLLNFVIGIFGSILAFIVWIYGMYATYMEVNAVNGA